MSALQNVFDSFSFDGAELEELAESLLCDILPDLEAGDCSSHEMAPKIESSEQQLSGSLVGSAAELMEPSRNTTADSFRIISDRKQNLSTTLEADTETVYGTYDKATNSIMIMMADGTKQIAEDAVQEVVSDVDEPGDLFTSHSYSSLDDHTYVSRKEDDILDPLDELLNFRNKSTNPFDCSSSDPGYESFTTSPPRTEENFNCEDFINWDVFTSLE